MPSRAEPRLRLSECLDRESQAAYWAQPGVRHRPSVSDAELAAMRSVGVRVNEGSTPKTDPTYWRERGKKHQAEALKRPPVKIDPWPGELLDSEGLVAGYTTREARMKAIKRVIDFSAGTAAEVPPMIKPAAKKAGGSEPLEKAPRLRLTPASAIKPRPVHWAWEGRIPGGELTLTPGRGGIGKSTFHTWLIAQLTRGILPGIYMGTPRACIIAASEDSWDRTIIPRLIAAGADMELVFKVDLVTQSDEEISISLPRDVEGLITEIDQLGVVLLSVDPVMSVLREGLDTHKDRDVRQALEPLSRLADRTGCVVLGNAHFNKSSGSDPVSRIMGSAAFANVARAALGFAGDDENSVVISQVKNNLGRLDLPSLRYRIEGVSVRTDEGPAEVGKLIMLGESDRSVADVLRDQETRGGRSDAVTAQSKAAHWLKQYLDDGDPVPSKQVLADGTDEGFSPRTIQRAKSELGVTSTPIPGTKHETTWSLGTPSH